MPICRYLRRCCLVALGVLRVGTLCVAIFAATMDFLVAYYFERMLRDCGDDDTSKCYCNKTKHHFHYTFSVGTYSCRENPFVTEPAYLVANAVLTIACAVVLAIYVAVYFRILYSGRGYML